MGNIKRDAIIPIVRSLDDMPVHVRQLAGLFRGQGSRLKRNKGSVNDIDRYDNGVVTTRGRNTKATHFGENGRPISERGTITELPDSSPRGDNATNIGREGKPGDQGGHLGAHRFFGDSPDEGIVPQAANLNLSAWKTMENEWADWVGKGYEVNYTIDITPPGARRPDSFEVEYTVRNPSTGEVIHRDWPEFANVAGQIFDRVRPEGMPNL
ncbi:DNA/RNA non-specific endonuclease [Microbacterium sp. A82]|uniref:DNA/RNA non-specific endonuclease n=1 Tax=unclassified Microbacterium TaxID=2609290 RepID=UPI003F2C610A